MKTEIQRVSLSGFGYSGIKKKLIPELRLINEE